MLTRCPSCHAAFSITDQQLEIAAGMVPCGMCEHVFDARLYLFDHTHNDMHEAVDVELGEEEAAAIDLEFLDRELHSTHPHLPEPPKVTLPSGFDITDNTDKPSELEQTQETTIPKVIADDVFNLDSETAAINPYKMAAIYCKHIFASDSRITDCCRNKTRIYPATVSH